MEVCLEEVDHNNQDITIIFILEVIVTNQPNWSNDMSPVSRCLSVDSFSLFLEPHYTSEHCKFVIYGLKNFEKEFNQDI